MKDTNPAIWNGTFSTKGRIKGELYAVELGGIDGRDCPDFSDVSIVYAEDYTGRVLTEEELNNVDSAVIYEHTLLEIKRRVYGC